mmetsp:Transcript_75297/g.232885  ORF Transcript_75297/g.232885 Transcript_75297/m.232885 type:complete len:276 (+) Transcript_75297:481-1308(+)
MKAVSRPPIRQGHGPKLVAAELPPPLNADGPEPVGPDGHHARPPPVQHATPEVAGEGPHEVVRLLPESQAAVQLAGRAGHLRGEAPAHHDVVPQHDDVLVQPTQALHHRVHIAENVRKLCVHTLLDVRPVDAADARLPIQPLQDLKRLDASFVLRIDAALAADLPLARCVGQEDVHGQTELLHGLDDILNVALRNLPLRQQGAIRASHVALVRKVLGSKRLPDEHEGHFVSKEPARHAALAPGGAVQRGRARGRPVLCVHNPGRACRLFMDVGTQ